MAKIKVYLENGVVFVTTTAVDLSSTFTAARPLAVNSYPANGFLTASVVSSTKVKVIASGNHNEIIFTEQNAADIVQKDGSTVHGANASATVTALNALFDVPVIENFVVKDPNTDNSGTTKFRHKPDPSGTADRDQAGTLELDTHSASIGLYDSLLKIDETDLGNTGGKGEALGRFTLDLQRLTGGASNVMTINMTQLSQAANGDFNFNSLDISGSVTFSSTQHTVTFSGDTSGIDYGDLSNTPTTIANLLADTSPQLGGDLDVNGQKIVTASNGDIVLDPNGTGKIILKSDDVRMEGEDSSIQVGTVKLYEADLGGDHFVSLQAPLSLNADLAFTLPAADGTSGQVLKTNGSGVLSFTDVVSTQNPVMTGTASFKQVATLPGAVKIFDGDNSHGVRLLAPTSLTADLDLTLPATDGSAGQFLKTDGNGNLSFASAGSSSGGDGNHYLGQFGGLFSWSSSDDGERVGLHSTYGPYYFSHSTEVDQTALKNYDASQAVDSATSTMDNYRMMIMGFQVHMTTKKVKCVYAFRVQSAPAGSTWGLSLWQGSLDTSGSTNSERTVTLRAKTDDITTTGTFSTIVYHGEVKTTSVINGGSIIPFLENRSGSLSTTTRIYGSFKLYLCD